MKSMANKEVNYSLHNSENYKKELECELNEAVNKLSELLIEYFKFITDKLTLKKSKFSRFIITRGLDTITNVFNCILFYTKNLELTYFHSQRAFYFYVEFVGQISEDEKMFLQLSSRDATTYVYKKTVFEINNEFKKNNDTISDYTQVKLDIINSYMEIFKTILMKLVNEDFMDLEKINKIELIYKKLSNLSNKSNIHLYNKIIDFLYYHIYDVKYFLDVCVLLVKKSTKHQEQLKNCVNNFLSEDFEYKIKETPDKFITWFMG